MNMIEDNWIPTDEDIKWTKQTIEQMSIGDTWGVADSILRKESEDHYDVLKASPASILPLQRIGKVLAELDIELTASNAEIVEDAQAAAQQSAQEWSCTQCDELIANFSLELGKWVLLDDDEHESWRVAVSHQTNDGETHEVALSPMDYHLVAGDELFFSWKNNDTLERERIIELADADLLMDALQSGEVFIMPTNYEGDLIPPHLRGLLFEKHNPQDEEE
jgi:hypothetical protein